MQKLKNMFHHHSEVPAAPVPPMASNAHVEKSHAVTPRELETVKKSLSSSQEELRTAELATALPTVTPILASTETEDKLIMKEPVEVKLVEKEVVVHEHVHPIEKEEIQPVIYREREQLEVKQITENLHETEVQPTLVQQRELPAQVKAPLVEKAAPLPENVVLPSVEVDATLKTVQVNQPIVNETIKKTIIKEVQPILEKDVVVPVLVQETQPIYEKIVEAPILIKEVLPTREINGGEAFNLDKVNPFLTSATLGKSTTVQQAPPTVL